LFAKLAAGPPGRQDLLADQQSLSGAQINLLAGQPKPNQTRNKQPPKSSFEGSWRMSTSLWKMCLDTDPLPDLLEPGLSKTTCMALGNMGYVPLPREQFPRTFYQRPCDQMTRGPPPPTHTGTTETPTTDTHGN